MMASQPEWIVEEIVADAPHLPAETGLEFYARRAMEEARAARLAASPEAAAAHMYLAAAYASELARETSTAEELERLALQIG